VFTDPDDIFVDQQTINITSAVDGVTEQIFKLFPDERSTGFSMLLNLKSSYVNHAATDSHAIDMDGKLSGSDINGCNYLSNFSEVKDSGNIYSVSIEISACGEFSGEYTGLAITLKPDNEDKPDTLAILLNNNSHAIAMELYEN